MLASRHFQISRTRRDDWFDPILTTDTQLFVDPFLIFKDKNDVWSSCHNIFVDHFEIVFDLVARANGNRKSLPFRKAIDLLMCREPREVCLGYSDETIEGAGTGIGKALRMARAVEDAINRGIENPEHFEEVGILNRGIGPDLVSDIALTILKPFFISYTQKIAKRHKLSLEEHTLYAAEFDEDRQSWQASSTKLPTNPFSGDDGGPLLLVPERFLRRLPTLNAKDWWAWYRAEQTVADLDRKIMASVSKDTIIKTARANLESVRKWVGEREDRPPDPYDVGRDKEGWHQWSEAGYRLVEASPWKINPPKSKAEFFDLVEAMIDRFRRFIEDQGGYKLLWDAPSGRPKPESAAQLLFRGVVEAYCEANNISLEREVDVGTGWVDLKMTRGYSQRVLIEVKKLENNKFEDNVTVQLPTYMKSEALTHGWYVVLQFKETDTYKKRKAAFPGMLKEVNKTGKFKVKGKMVDAVPRPSASKRKPTGKKKKS